MSFKKTAKDVLEWKPIEYTIDNLKYAVLLLNHSLDHLNGQRSQSFDNIWQKANRRLAVDGGAKYLTPDHKCPDILSGDFDSITEQQLNYFRQKGAQIIATPDQNFTDFSKAVQIVLNSNKGLKTNNNNNCERIDTIIAVWSSMGRIDQVMACIDTLYKFIGSAGTDGQYVPIFLVQIQNSISFLLNKGCHVIESNQLSKWCSLVPIGSPCCVTTSGFRWNLNKQILSFGSLISTSNEFDKNESTVRIETDRPLLYSFDISKSNQF